MVSNFSSMMEPVKSLMFCPHSNRVTSAITEVYVAMYAYSVDIILHAGKILLKGNFEKVYHR